MPTKIKTPEPNMTLSYQGEVFVSGKDRMVVVPDAAAAVFIETHGCEDPEHPKVLPEGREIIEADHGGFVVIDSEGTPLHPGSLPRDVAEALARSIKEAPIAESTTQDADAPKPRSRKKSDT